MNDRQQEKQVRQDAAKVTQDLNVLVSDGVERINRLEESLGQTVNNAQKDVTTWVDENVSQMSHSLGKASAETRARVVETATAVKKDVGHGLSQYNQKAQTLANQIPGDFGDQAARYPWVAMSFALLAGFLLGILFKPVQQSASRV